MPEKVNAISKAIIILKELSKHDSCSVIELSNNLKFARSTIHRTLNILSDERMVMQDPSTKKYEIGPAAYYLGSSYLNNIGNITKLRHVLNEAARDIEQSLGFAKLEDNKIINIYEVESYQKLTIGYKTGSYFPFHSGAVGKCISAFLDSEEKLNELVFKSELTKFTPTTITTREGLIKELSKIKQKGYSTSDGENIEGIYGFAAPVFNYDKKIIGAINSAVLKIQLTDEMHEKIIRNLLKTAKILSKFF